MHRCPSPPPLPQTGVQLISGAASVTGNEVTQAASQPPSTASSQTVSTSGTSTQVLGKGNDATAFGAVSTAVSWLGE